MTDIDGFFEILKEVCDELPDEFFRELHHGVQLAEEIRISHDQHPVAGVFLCKKDEVIT